MPEQAIITEEEAKNAVSAAIKLADFLHHKQVRHVFCLEKSGRLVGRIVLDVFSKRYPRERPPNFMFLSPAGSFSREEHAKHPDYRSLKLDAETAQEYVRALETESKERFGHERSFALDAVRGKEPIMILDDLASSGRTLFKQRELFSQLRGTNKGIFAGALLGPSAAKKTGLRFGADTVRRVPSFYKPGLTGSQREPGKVFARMLKPLPPEAIQVRREIRDFVDKMVKERRIRSKQTRPRPTQPRWQR